MESHPISVKRPRLCIEESVVDRQSPEMETRPPKRRLCNELVSEVCRAIPVMKQSEETLLTSVNMNSYLETRFRKKLLIYGDAIGFLKAKLTKSAERGVFIWIDQMASTSNDNAVVQKRQSVDEFELAINRLRIRMSTRKDQNVPCWVSVEDGQFVNVHALQFLHLIAPSIRPIKLVLSHYYYLGKPIEPLLHFLHTQSHHIDWVELHSMQLSVPICRTLARYDQLNICGPSLGAAQMHDFIRWLNADNGGRPKKCFFHRATYFGKSVQRLFDAIIKNFLYTNSRSRFVIGLELRNPLSELILRNGRTGERLELRCIDEKAQFPYHILSRSPIPELKEGSNEREEEFKRLEDGTDRMAKIILQ